MAYFCEYAFHMLRKYSCSGRNVSTTLQLATLANATAASGRCALRTDKLAEYEGTIITACLWGSATQPVQLFKVGALCLMRPAPPPTLGPRSSSHLHRCISVDMQRGSVRRFAVRAARALSHIMRLN